MEPVVYNNENDVVSTWKSQLIPQCLKQLLKHTHKRHANKLLK